MMRPTVGGYVLAGGKSSRMGRDKALLELAGKPLVWYAVTKLRPVCAEVHVLSARRALEVFAPLVPDVHEGCGPLGGMEAALEHSMHEWSLFVPVDVPFLPSALLERWVREMTGDASSGVRVAFFTAEGFPQPLLCLLHRDVKGFVVEAVAQERYKVLPVLQRAAAELASRMNVTTEVTLWNKAWEEESVRLAEDRSGEGEGWRTMTEAQQLARPLWFANLNTPEEFGEAELHAGALDR